MMKIIYSFLAIFTVLTASTSAQTNNDPDAKKILDAKLSQNTVLADLNDSGRKHREEIKKKFNDV